MLYEHLLEPSPSKAMQIDTEAVRIVEEHFYKQLNEQDLDPNFSSPPKEKIRHAGEYPFRGGSPIFDFKDPIPQSTSQNDSTIHAEYANDPQLWYAI